MIKKYLIVILFLLAVPASLQSREFLNTVLHLNFGGMYSVATTGDLIDSENNAVDTQIPSNSSKSHYETAYCITLDIVPTDPIILGMEDHAIKFGLRGSYRFHYLQQKVKVGVDVGDQCSNL